MKKWLILIIVLLLTATGCIYNKSETKPENKDVEIERFNIVFDSGGGSIVGEIKNVTKGAVIAEPDKPIKNGYDFIGWYSDKELNTVWKFDVDKIEKNMTLYAKWREKKVPDEMVLVTAGITTVKNGSIEVKSDFYISKFETLQNEFKDIMGYNPSNNKSLTQNMPVEEVTWYDAVVYCNKKSSAEGLEQCYTITDIAYFGTTTESGIKTAKVTADFSKNGYRLPTSDEWIYASRGGENGAGYIYSGGDTPNDVCWNIYNSGSVTHPIGGKKPNELGLYDMSGNVWEWTMPVGNDKNVHGGSCTSKDHIAVATWWYYQPGYRDEKGGFRVARNR